MTVVVYDAPGGWEPPESFRMDPDSLHLVTCAGLRCSRCYEAASAVPPGVLLYVAERREAVASVAASLPILSTYREHRENWIVTGDVVELIRMIESVEQEYPLDPR